MYDVSLDTSGLTVGDQYAVDFQLNQGDPANAVSTVNVANFVFGNGGAATGTPTTSGPVTGSIASPPVTLTNTGGSTAQYTQNFDNGPMNNGTGSIGFTVDGSQLSAPAMPGTSAPDQFLFDLFDTTTNTQVAASGPGNALFTLTNDGPTSGTNMYTATSYSYTDTMGMPIMTSALPATPELGAPITFGVLLGLFGLGVVRNRRVRAQS